MTHAKVVAVSLAALACSMPGLAAAHISIASGLATANATQEISFGVGHGCTGADTSRVSIEIPAGVTSVRPETSDFGRVDVETDSAGTIVMVHFTKDEGTLLEADTQYYKLVVRLKVPDAPFSTLYFPTQQTCVAADGTTTVVDWVGLGDTEGTDVEPAPALQIVPARYPGWNRFTVAGSMTNLDAFFGDAQIVWKGSAAYSINPTTLELIGSTSGVTLLESLGAGDEIWVKY